jgi:hypothetical protein
MMRSLLTFLLLALAAAPALATLDGSTAVVFAPGNAHPGGTVTFSFELTNNSPDGEAVREVRITFPEDSDALGGSWDDYGQGWDFDITITGEYDNYISFFDADGDPGEILPGQSGFFSVEVYLHTNMDCGTQFLDVRMFGDEGGDDPHWWKQDDNPWELCTVATEPFTWSSVKSLYE